MLADQNAQLTVDTNSLFDEITGATFEGTCQMPGEPSQRVRLSIDRVRDRGGNLSARLSLMEGRRTSKPFVGVIDGKPAQLILKADIAPGNIPMANIGLPWHAPNLSPTIRFSPSDADTLIGSSAVGEEFELRRKQPRSTRPSTAPTQRRSPSLSEGGLFQIATRNAQTLEHDERWRFGDSDSGRGQFKWTRDGATKATGTYQLAGTGDIQKLEIWLGDRLYHCHAQSSQSSGRLKVWAPRVSPGKGRRDASDHVLVLKPLDS